nr:manganese efflux pump [Acetonema longum]
MQAHLSEVNVYYSVAVIYAQGVFKMNILYVIFLALAVSLDSFVAGATYGIRQIRMPAVALTVVGVITMICTGVAMLLAEGFGNFIDPHVAAIIGAVLLLCIGLFSIFQEYLTRNVGPYAPDSSQKITIRIGKLLIHIMADPEAVDFDRSKSISVSEAMMLGLALGLDNMVATFAACLLGILPLYTPIVMGMIQALLILLGIHAAIRFMPDRIKKKFPYFSGAMLVLMGIVRLVK